MAFDPSLPVNHSKIVAAELRAQFNGIVDLIQTIPQGPQGVPGPPGTSVTGAVVDGVSSLNPGEPATASASFDGALVHFSFGLTRGNDGTAGATGGQGPQGIQGIQGDVGPQGPMFTSFNVNSTTTLDPGQPASVQTFFDGASIRFNFGIPRGNDGLQGPIGPTGATGPAFTSFTVDSVTTLQPFQPATVTATFDGTYVRFAFGIPQGQTGPQGNNGFDGATGAQGTQGPPGEVTAAQLAGAIAGTASNTNPIATLDLVISDPPTQGELQQVLAKLNELIVGLRRA
jgi:hypothetical protein